MARSGLGRSGTLVVALLAALLLAAPATAVAAEFTADVAGEAGGGESEPCADRACTVDAQSVLYSHGGIPHSADGRRQQPVAVSVDASANVAFPFCDRADHHGPWQPQWWERPVNSTTGLPGPGWVKLADFGPLAPGASATRVLPSFADSNFRPVIVWRGTSVQCAQFHLAGSDASCGELKLNASVTGYETGRTAVTYDIRGIGRKCGTVVLVVADHRAVTLRPTHRSAAGTVTVKGRFCDPDIFAHQNGARVSAGPGFPQIATVLYGHDLTGHYGERLRTGDKICQGEDRNAKDVDAHDILGSTRLHLGPHGVALLRYGRVSTQTVPGPDGAPTPSPIKADELTLDDGPAHIHIVGTIEARRLVLGLGGGRQATVHPPQVGAATQPFDPSGQQSVPDEATCSSTITLTGFAYLQGPGFSFGCPLVLDNGVLVSPGSITLHRGVTGTGAILAQRDSQANDPGDIVITGNTDLFTDAVIALASPGTVRLG